MAEGTSSMHGRSSRAVLRHLRTLYAFGVIGDLTDEQLLQCFVRRDKAAEEAFAILVERHGAMVLGVCLRVLGNNSHEAEDAFQATFLVLARKAGSVSRRDKLASWLYGAALRTANQSRRRTARRRTHEERASVPTSTERPDSGCSGELRTILDEELSRLPAAHRVAVILCELEGLSRTEAARRLDIPEGTLSSRLARAKIQLRDRLTRRGLALTTFSLSSMFVRESHAISVPLSLIESTLAGASQLAANTSLAASVVTVSVATLTEGVLQTMFVTKLKAGVMSVGTLAAVVSAAMVLGQSSEPPQVRSAVAVTAPDNPAPQAPDTAPRPDPMPPASASGRIADGRPGPMRSDRGDELHPIETEQPPVSSFVPKPANAPKVAPAPPATFSPEDRTAALEKKLDRILNALDRMASPAPTLARLADQVDSAPVGRLVVTTPEAEPDVPAINNQIPESTNAARVKPRASATRRAEPVTLPQPAPRDDDVIDPANGPTDDEPSPVSRGHQPVPMTDRLDSQQPVPMTNRLDTLEMKLDKAIGRVKRLEDRMHALEKLVGVKTVQSSEDTKTPKPPIPINQLEALPRRIVED